MKMTTTRPEATADRCTLIQWGKLKVDDKGNPICPQCSKPAENILGFFGIPCWAHAITNPKVKQ